MLPCSFPPRYELAFAYPHGSKIRVCQDIRGRYLGGVAAKAKQVVLWFPLEEERLFRANPVWATNTAQALELK